MVLTRKLLVVPLLVIACSFGFAAEPIWQQFDSYIRNRQFEQAVALLTPLAKAQDARACYELAQLYRNGIGVAANPEHARHLLLVASQQGHSDSQYLLGLFFSKGVGGSKDIAQARHWLQLAADQHHRRAKDALSTLASIDREESPAISDPVSAASQGDIATLRATLTNPAAHKQIDQAGNSLLMLALRHHHQDTAAWLLERGANLQQQNRHGETALHQMVDDQQPGFARWLLDSGADPDLQNNAGKTPLHLAVEKNDAALVDLLLSHKANPALRDKKNQTPLEKANVRQRVGIIAVFDRYGIRLQDGTLQHRLLAAQESDLQATPLEIAVERGDLALVEALLKDARSPWQPNHGGHTLVTLAAQQKNTAVLKKLLHAAKGAGMTGPRGNSALFFAIAANQQANVALLLNSGANPLQENDESKTVVELALASYPAYTATLIDHIAPKRWQASWLVTAARQGDATLTQRLLNNGVDANIRDTDGRSALWHASAQGHPAIVKTLLKHGAMPLAADRNGDTPLHRAVAHPAVLKMLLEGISTRQLDLANHAGSTALHHAASGGYHTSCNALMDAGANKDTRDSNGNTPLIVAVLAHQPEAVRVLLSKGASLRKRNSNKQDAFAIAEQLNYKDILEQLEAAQADKGVLGIFH